MGSNFAQDLASGEFVQSIDQQVSIHFAGNCYPPVPQFMVEPAVKAINQINEGDTTTEIELPAGVEFRNSSTCTPWEIVNALRLNAWINEED